MNGDKYMYWEMPLSYSYLKINGNQYTPATTSRVGICLVSDFQTIPQFTNPGI